MPGLVLGDSAHLSHGALAGEEDEAGHRATDDRLWVPAVREELICGSLLPLALSPPLPLQQYQPWADGQTHSISFTQPTQEGLPKDSAAVLQGHIRSRWRAQLGPPSPDSLLQSATLAVAILPLLPSSCPPLWTTHCVSNVCVSKCSCSTSIQQTVIQQGS